MVGAESCGAEGIEDEIVDFDLGHAGAGTEGGRDLVERATADGIDQDAGVLVRAVGVLAPAGFEELDQVGRGDDFDTQGTDHLHRPGIDVRNVGNGAIGRILHGDAPAALKNPRECGRLFLPAGVMNDLAGQRGEDIGFDAVGQADGVAFSWDEIVPAPGDRLRGFETENAVSDGVAAVVVEEEPSIQALLAEGRLNLSDAHETTLSRLKGVPARCATGRREAVPG